MAFSIGVKDIKSILAAGASGIIRGLISTASTVTLFFMVNALFPKKERNAMGVAIGYTALNVSMTPATVAETDPSLSGNVGITTAQCATTSIITLFLCPFVTAAFDKYMRKAKKGF